MCVYHLDCQGQVNRKETVINYEERDAPISLQDGPLAPRT